MCRATLAAIVLGLFVAASLPAHADDTAVAALSQPSSAEDFYARAIDAGKQGDFKQALSDLTVAISLAPNGARAYLIRALVYDKLGQSDLAKADRATASNLPHPLMIGDPSASPFEPPDPDIEPSRMVGRTHDCSSYYSLPSERAHEFGYVYVGYDVGADGAITNVQLVGSSGFRRLDDRALDCVREQWRNTPALKKGVPISSPGHLSLVRFWISDLSEEDERYMQGFAMSLGPKLVGFLTQEIARRPNFAPAYRARAGQYEIEGDHARALQDLAKADGISPLQ